MGTPRSVRDTGLGYKVEKLGVRIREKQTERRHDNWCGHNNMLPDVSELIIGKCLIIQKAFFSLINLSIQYRPQFPELSLCLSYPSSSVLQKFASCA